MTDAVRPSGDASSELRRTIWPWSTEIPLLSADPFNLDARLIIGGQEYVRCTGRDGYTLTGCERGISPEEGGSEAKLWGGGTSVDQIAWTTTEVVTDYPDTPTLAMVGRDFAWDAGDGNIYRYHVVLIELAPVVIWDDEPPPAATDLTFLWASLITSLTGISGVAVDPSQNVYVWWDSSATPDYSGSLRRYVAGLGSSTSQLGVSTGAARLFADATNLFSVTPSTVGKRVAATLAAGSPASIGTPGSGDGQLNGVADVVSDGTHIWVADAGNNRVQKFLISTGAYVSQFPIPSDPPSATGITLGPTSTHLYVLCAGAGEIRKHLKSDHSLVSAFLLGNGTADGQISTTAEGIAVDSTGRIWIADTGNHRVQVYDSTGVFLGKVGSFGSGDSQFKSPKQIAVGSGDVIYVADSGNGRLVTVQEEVVVPPGVAALVLVHKEDFSAVSSVSVDSIFSSTYENYLIVLSNMSQSATQDWWLRLRASGTDDSAGNHYMFSRNQTGSGAATTLGGSTGANMWNLVAPAGAATTGGVIEIVLSRPQVAAETSCRWGGQVRDGNQRCTFGGGYHTQATAYDGCTLLPASGTISGTLRIYGMRNTV